MRLLKEYGVLLLAPVILFSPVVLRGQVLFWGTPALQFVPWWWQAWEQIRMGVIPLWNPLNGMGAPLMANYQMALFYPPNIVVLLPLAALAGPAGVAWGYTLLAILHLAWGGLGMAFLLRQLGFGWLAQILGGLAYGLSGYVVGKLGFLSMTWVAAWLPWVLYFTERLLEKRQRLPLSAGLAGSVAMQLLAGHAQLSWYTLVLAGIWFLAGIWRAAAWRRSGALLLGLAVSLLLGAAIAMVQLLPTFEYLSQSQRADAVQYDEVMRYSFWPWRFISIFSPDFFGNPGQGSFWGYATYWEDHVYAGMTPLALALASLVVLIKGIFIPARRTPHWKLSLFLWGLVVITFVLALGQNTPVFPFLYRFVPTFDMFQAPARYLIWLAAALPVLAATGVERWRSPTGKGLYWFRLGTAGCFAVTLGAVLAWLTQESVQLTFIRATALAGIWALGFGLLTLVIPLVEKKGWQATWRWGVVGWTIIDLAAAGWLLNPGVDVSFYQNEPGRLAVGNGRLFLMGRLEYDLKFHRFMRFKDFRPLEDWHTLRSAALPNLNLLDGLPTANNFDPLVPGRYARWMLALEDRSPQELEAWLDLMAVSQEEKIDLRQPSGVRFDSVNTQGRLRWYACIQKASDEEDAWQKLESALARPSPNIPLIVEGWQGQDLGDCDSQANAEIRVIAERPDRLTLEVQSDAPGWVLLSDTWYPGWQARLDGTPTALYRAQYLFRAVAAPAGKHRIDIFYTSEEFYSGALLGILGLLALIAVKRK